MVGSVVRGNSQSSMGKGSNSEEGQNLKIKETNFRRSKFVGGGVETRRGRSLKSESPSLKRKS